MSKFEEVCSLSCDLWVSSFPEKIPEHIFSKEHNEKMKAILNNSAVTSLNSFKTSKKTFKYILVAAVLMALAVTATGIAQNKEYLIKKFSSFSEYDVLDTENAEKVTSFEVNYVPEGFVRTEEYIENEFYIEEYSKDDIWFRVDKSSINSTIWFDAEEYESEIILINGIEAVYYRSNEECCGIIYNDGNYIYSVDGNISKEELIKILQGLE